LHISGLCLVMLWSAWPISWRSTPKDWWPNSGTSASLPNGRGRPRLAPTPPLGRLRFTTHKQVPSGEPATKCATCCPLCGGTWSTPVLPPAWNNASPNVNSSWGSAETSGSGPSNGSWCCPLPHDTPRKTRNCAAPPVCFGLPTSGDHARNARQPSPSVCKFRRSAKNARPKTPTARLHNSFVGGPLWRRLHGILGAVAHQRAHQRVAAPAPRTRK
jgi:hypothetical protein